MITQKMTIDEMAQQFDGQWILIGNPELGANHEVVAGEVLFHSDDCDEVYQRAASIAPVRCAFLFMGEAPSGMEFWL